MVGRNPTPGAFYPTATAAFGAITSRAAYDNESLDMNAWDSQEFQKFMKWFIEANHPEAVKEYQAVRAIERKVEQEEANRRYMERLEFETQLRARALAQQAQTSYTSTATQESIWDAMKRMAGIK